MRAALQSKLDRIEAAAAIPDPPASASPSCPDCMPRHGERVRFIPMHEHPDGRCRTCGREFTGPVFCPDFTEPG